ncbi:MAG: glycosyltransferase [Bacteroidales bacterium]|nr:glycosyltransferase [Candidatus Scybalocola fimicaballi]
MKILHISKYCHPYVGGVENICKYLVEGDQENESAVVCFNSTSHDVEDCVNGHKVYRVGSQLSVARQSLSWNYRKILKKAIKEYKPDLIVFHWANPFPAWVLLDLIPKDIKLVVYWHMDIIKQKMIYKFIKPVETKLVKRADAIVVTSPNYKDCSLPLQHCRDKVFVVPNAIDDKTMNLREGDNEKIEIIKQKYNNKPIVFFVGRHIQYKGLPHLIKAAEFIKSDCIIAIAGSGPLTAKLKKQCKSDKVKFLGKISNDELRQMHYAASVFAFPSITKNEAFGVALAEAMYAETPAVTFTINGSGVNWVSLNGETCLEVPNGDDKAYANAIDTLLENETLRTTLAKNGRKRVLDNFMIHNMIEKMNDVINRL